MEVTEQIILTAATELFLTRGYSRTTTSDIAKHAKANKALIHYYFSDKKTIYDIAVKEVMEDLLATLGNLNREIPFYYKIKVFQDFRDLLTTKYPYLPVILISPHEPGHELAIKLLKNTKLMPEAFIKELKLYSDQLNLPVHEPKAIIVYLLSIAVFPFLFKDFFQQYLQIDQSQYGLVIDEEINKLLYFVNNNPVKT